MAVLGSWEQMTVVVEKITCLETDLASDCCLRFLLCTTSWDKGAPFPIVFLQSGCKHFNVGASFDFVMMAERSWPGPQVTWRAFLSGGIHVDVTHVPPDLYYTTFPVDTPNVNLRNVSLGAGENESVSFLF